MRPPRSSAIRTTAWLAPTPARTRTAASNPVTNFISGPGPIPPRPVPGSTWVMQNAPQRVARSDFCPDSEGGSNQIQIECCSRAAPWPPQKVPKWNKLTFGRRGPLNRPFTVDRGLARGLQSFRDRGDAMAEDADVIVVGGGLAGLVAATEIADAGRRVIVVDQEGEQSLGGQAFWSFGGLFLVDSPEQRRLGIKDSFDLALQDWMESAGFDRDEDLWPKRWAEAYVAFAAGEKRGWLRAMGHRIFPVVGWAERGGYDAMSHGNSVPRFHVSWGTGPGIVEPFERRARQAQANGRLTFRFRHRVDALGITGGAVDGVSGAILEADDIERGKSSSRKIIGDFTLRAQAVIVASGGIGGNHDLVRQNWPKRLGEAPKNMISGVPEHVDGRMIGITEAAGARLINRDRMWHYVEGIRNWSPIWPRHGIRILPGPSSMWFDATGTRLPGPLYPGYDTLGTLEHIMSTGYDYSWFVLMQSIIKKEFALSGS